MSATAGRARADAEPSGWIVRFARLVRPGGAVLDVACGSGRHARYFEERGHPVTAVDRDREALHACGASETIAFDLEAGAPWPLGDRRFAAVVVTNYLHRPLFPALLAALEEGGVLLYETFAVGNQHYGRPSNPDFLLESGELLAVCGALDVVAYEDGLVGDPPRASLQRVCAIAKSTTGATRAAADVATTFDARRHAL